MNWILGIFRRSYRIFSRLSKGAILFLSIASVALLSYIDYATGFELSFAVFYLLPVSFVAWFVGGKAGLWMSLASSAIWQIVNVLAGESFSSPYIPYWNAATRLGLFTVVTLLLSELRLTMDHERELSRTDFLTGVLNSRAFYEIAEYEIRRSHRYRTPFTVVYIDLDNFKNINDQHGHNVGDYVLQRVAGTIQSSIRTTDFVARIGGDEFVILMLEASEDTARVIIGRVQASLLEEMDLHEWPVTFSMGVLSCSTPPTDVFEMIRQADAVMYTVKNDGKNKAEFSSYSVTPAE